MAVRGRPRKAIERHIVERTFRPKRHAHLLPTAAEPAPSPPEPEEDPAQAELRKSSWGLVFETGHCFFDDIPGLVDPVMDRRLGYEAAELPLPQGGGGGMGTAGSGIHEHLDAW